MFRDYGRKGRYEHVIKGCNSRLDTVQAVILEAKLKHLDDWNKMRYEKACYYNQLLADIPQVITPTMKEDRTHVFQTYAVRVPQRDKVLEGMKAAGIGVLIHYPIPVHLQVAYAELGYQRGDIPISEKLGDEELSLPMFPHITEEQIDVVCKRLKEITAQLFLA